MRRRGNWRKGFGQRFGRYDVKLKQAITNRHTLWMHAVSVGEVNVCTQLIRALEPRLPNLKIVVSTTTTTGMGELQRKLPTHISKIYYPIDYRRLRHARAQLDPSRGDRAGRGGDLAELSVAGPRHAACRCSWSTPACRSGRIAATNGFGFLFRPLFASFAGVGAQNEADAARLRELGCRPEAIRVVGNLKFDAAKLDERRLLDVPALLRQLGVPAGAPVLVGGSTHAGEEALLAEQFLRLRERFPDLFLVLVPRHFERSREVGRELEARGVKFAYRNEIARRNAVSARRARVPAGQHDRRTEVLLRTRHRHLRRQEPHGRRAAKTRSSRARWARRWCSGRTCRTSQMWSRSFLAAGRRRAGARRGGAGAERWATCWRTAPRREQLGRNALKVVRENLGAIERTVEMIVEHLRWAAETDTSTSRGSN